MLQHVLTTALLRTEVMSRFVVSVTRNTASIPDSSTNTRSVRVQLSYHCLLSAGELESEIRIRSTSACRR
jgi:hypothetical protein